MPHKEVPASSAEQGGGPGEGGTNVPARPGGAMSRGRELLRYLGPWRVLCVVLVSSIVLSLLPSFLSSAGIHFGLISAVKTKVKELAVKVRAHTAPASLAVVTVTSNTISLAWRDNAKDESAIEIERRGPGQNAFSQLTLIPPDTISHLDSGLASGSTYYYRIRVYTPIGWSNYSNEVSTVTLSDGAGDGEGGGGGEEEGEPDPEAPRISSFTVIPLAISTGGVTSITCWATSPLGYQLTYAWESEAGTISGSGSSIFWTAPVSTGVYAVNCTVTDTASKNSSKDALVYVTTEPVIISLTAAPQKISTGRATTVTCIATTSIGVGLDYVWTAGSGTITGAGYYVDWTAPFSTGSYMVSCEVTDSYGVKTSSTLLILVNNLEITSLTATPAVVYPSSASVVECAVSGQDGQEVTYAWEWTGGEITGSGASVTWTAPGSTGSYTITCEVTDGTTTVSREVAVWSATGPVIISLTSADQKVSTGGVTNLICLASSPAPGELSYVWSAASGTIQGTDDIVTWLAPLSTGTYVITCEVTDGDGVSVSSSLWVLVNNLAITSLTAMPAAVYPSSDSVVECAATGPSGSGLTYTWTPTAGLITGTGASVIWTAPQSPGGYQITCEVTDGVATVTRDVSVWSATGPVIISLTAAYPKVSTGAATNIICVASSPAPGALSYVWSAASGTLAGGGYTVGWTAPLSTGIYVVNCEVTDGDGVKVSSSLWVLVNNLAITSLTATPAAVYPSSDSIVECLATGPSGSELTYAWKLNGEEMPGTGTSVIWTAPEEPGSHSITCEVTDGVATVISNVDVWSATGPVIISLAAADQKVSTGAATNIICVASSPAPGALSYVWSAAGGTISGSGDTIDWTAPLSTGTYVITCEVTDPYGVKVSSSLWVLVNNLAITSLTATPAVVYPSSDSVVECEAAGPSGSGLIYTWTPTGGLITGTGASVIWTAPEELGEYSITCEVNDGVAAVTRLVDVWSATGPVIISLAATDPKVSTGAATIIICVASSPAPGALSYVWSAASGTISDSGDTIYWTAPLSTGTYVITCEVTDPYGVKASSTLWVLVNNLAITSLTATPAVVYPSSDSVVECEAAGPSGSGLTYTWTPTGGLITGTGASVIWTAPEELGEYSITCEVTDGVAAVTRVVDVWSATGPVIISLAATDPKVSTGAATIIICESSSPAPGELSYVWSAASGTISGSGNIVGWTAPLSTGTYVIICEVTDPYGVKASSTLWVLVNNLAITSLTATPAVVYPSSDSVVECEAAGPSGSGLTYTWTPTGGLITGTGASVIWTAPEELGEYSITCEATDGVAAVTREVDVWSATGPVIISLMAEELKLSTGAATDIICLASSPAPGALSYVWSAASGTISGSGDTIYWAAPLSTGTYVITCEVTDSYGVKASSTLWVLVNNLAITSLTATPAVVYPSSDSVVDCAAAGPSGSGLTYTWTPTGGLVTGTGASVIWTAPEELGEYSITCEVNDGVAAVTREVAVWSATGPVFISLMADEMKVSTGGASDIICLASSPAPGELSYVWSAASGTIAGSGATIEWSAPLSTGMYVINCEVTDPYGVKASSALLVLVNNLALASLTAAPAVVYPSSDSVVECAISGASGAGLTYTWTPTGGLITGTGASVIWTAPEELGDYSITCDVTDGAATVTRDVDVWSATGPVITLLSAENIKVSTGGATEIVCLASSPAPGELSYVWSAASGTVSGSGATVNWSAPLSTGMYVVNCEVTDPYGVKASSALLVLVNNLSLASLTAAPAVVYPSSDSVVECAVSGASGAGLTYTWTPTGGLITGTGALVTWTAPEELGGYLINCGVTDGVVTLESEVLVRSATGPVITSLTAESQKVSTGAATAMICVASSPAPGELSYNWTAGSGTITSYGSTTTWTAPLSTGIYMINCEVTDSYGVKASSSTSVLVNNLAVTSLTAMPGTVYPSSDSVVECAVAGASGAGLTYTWTPTGGLITGTGSLVTWTAPEELGGYLINCGVTDGVVTLESEVLVRSATGPVITSLSASPTKVSTGAVSDLICLSTSPAPGDLSYSWTAGSGTITSYGSTATWTAPFSTGTYMINCEVTDFYGVKASSSLSVLVNNLAITSLTATPAVVYPTSNSVIECAVAGASGAGLTYTWTPTGGLITGTGASVTWTAPEELGEYLISCEVTDGVVTLVADVSVRSATGPVIISLTAESLKVSTGAATAMICVASSPAPGELSYNWTAGSGTITSYGSTATWTAPLSAGTFVINCEVTDSYGVKVSSSLSVLVNNLAITSLTATPAVVYTGSDSVVECAVSGASGSELTYTWTPDGGLITGTGASVTWTAPESTGSYSITCEVTDGTTTLSSDVPVWAATGPVVISLTAVSTKISTGAATAMICLASSPAPGDLSYNWTSGSGTITSYGSTSTWTAPLSTGTYLINCEITDFYGVKASSSLLVVVNNLAITSLTATPPVVYPSSDSVLECAITGPSGSELTYTWTPTAGLIGGTGASVTWTAPESTGSYSVKCEVSDGVVILEREVSVWSATGPVIASLTASPAKVSTGAAADLICLATSPAPGDLSYNWTAGSGTITSYGSTATWTAPLATGTYLINCEVTDGEGVKVSSSAAVVVNNLAIASLTAVPLVLAPFSVSTLTCTAAGPPDPELSYTWTETGGGFLEWDPALDQDQAEWLAPVSTGIYTLTCEISDPGDNKVSRSIDVLVASMPVILSLTAAPDWGPKGVDSLLVCVATAPDNRELSYTWSADSGTLLEYVSSATWTAPYSTGTYNVGCQVEAAGLEGVAFSSVAIIVNTPPAVSSVTAAPPIVSTGNVSVLTCQAVDEDFDELTYSWDFVYGSTANASGNTVEWTAPESTGVYSVSCGVSDGKPGGTGQGQTNVRVATGPVIISLTAAPGTVPQGAESVIVCVGTAPDNRELSYTWSADSGTLLEYVSSATWTAPYSTGTYNVGCQVEAAGLEGLAFSSVSVLVNSLPGISGVTAEPSMVFTGSNTVLTCNASDDDGDGLTYSWSAVYGSTWGAAGNMVNWTAPESTGVYSVVCEVSDGQPGEPAQGQASITVATSAAILSLLAAPEMVPQGAESVIVCVGTAPDNRELSYTWSAESGTLLEYVSSATWTAPYSTGPYSVGCQAQAAGLAGVAFSSVSVFVNSQPMVSGVTAEPSMVFTGSNTVLTCNASDDDGDELSYSWSALYGSTSNASGNTVEWTAPESTGVYSVACDVSDGQPGEPVQGLANVTVATSVAILDLTAAPGTVPQGAESVIVCVGTAPDNRELSYTWSKDSGTLLEYVSSATWTAPAATGTYIVGCQAQAAGLEGVAFSSVAVLVNSPPAVSGVTAEPSMVSTGSVSVLTCNANDADGDELSYSWSALYGSTSNASGNTVEWTAPESTGVYSVACEVSDGHPGGTGQGQANVTVATSVAILSLTAAPGTVPQGAESVIVCVGTAPDNRELSYTWSKDSGTLLEYVSSATWTAPAATGTYIVGCQAQAAGLEGVAFSSVALVVNSPPVISGVTAEPSMVSTGSVSVLTCNANDADGDELSYSWSAVYGSTANASGNTVEWTAPESTGVYSVACEVYDGHPGGTGQGQASVTVATSVALLSLTAAPETVTPDGESIIVCVATAPDNRELSYTWSKDSGTLLEYVSSATWTAPAATGTYNVGCQAQAAGLEVAASSSVAIVVNTPPVISAVLAEPSMVSTGSVSVLTCHATDDDGDELTYSWSAVYGSTANASGNTVEWTAPESTGSYSVSCEVSDGKPGGTGSNQASITVTTGAAILSLTAAPDTVPQGAESVIVCVATAPDNRELSYTWSKDSGTLLEYVSSATWTAPAATGTYNVGCQVEAAGLEGVVLSSVAIVVNTPPVISAVTAEPSMVSTGSVSVLTCHATDDDGDELSYSWSALYGSTSNASGNTVEWTAPESTGVYSVDCEVSDGKSGGPGPGQASVTVATGAVILSLTAAPGTVPQGAESVIVCVATAPDNRELSYTWSKDSGTLLEYVSSATWTAPAATGTYNVGCQVEAAGLEGVVLSSVAVLVNSPPEISGVTAEPSTLSTASVSVLTCNATDMDGDELTYSWSFVYGSTSGASGNTVDWTAPESTGSYSVTCGVSDGSGGTDSDEVVLTVTGSDPPEISSVTAQPDIVSPGGVSTVTCSAWDANNPVLEYTWSATGGSTATITDSAIRWTAPGSTGTYTVTCGVSDGEGGSDQEGENILVSSMPRITSLTATPKVSTGALAVVECLADSPDNGTLEYAWSSSSGTVTGTGAEVSWQAPPDTGTYIITCDVTAVPAGGVSRSTVAVLVNNPPVIVSVTGNPGVVSPLRASTITCSATDPDNDIIYEWWAVYGSTAEVPGQESQVLWTAPGSSGSYLVNCGVSDGEGGTDSDNIEMIVSSVPFIASLIPSAEKVSTTSFITLTCSASAPDNDTLLYDWLVGSGTIVGTGANVTWNPPGSTGTYSIVCEAEGVEGGGVSWLGVNILVNNPPVIASLSADPTSLSTGAVSVITCVASDPDNPVSYDWSAASGTITGTGSEVNWTAPASSGTYTITCEVSDGEGGLDQEIVQVTALINGDPVITSLVPDSGQVPSSGQTDITCTAEDPDDPVLLYTWTPGSGTITGTGADVSWSAPADTGTYMITCDVSDGHGGDDSETINILVNNPPVISNLYAEPSLLLPFAVSTVTCSATDPDNPVIFGWSATGGSTETITAEQIKWIAPESTGTYVVTCTASDGEGGEDQSGVNLTVSSLPVIQALTASPSIVSTGAVSEINCEAEMPGGGALTYDWTPGSGTITGTGAAVTWTAPSSTGSYMVECEVTSDAGSVSRTLVIAVNNLPVISSLTAEPVAVSPSVISTITCTAYDPDNGDLVYNWSYTGGSFELITAGQIEWTAPSSSGTYSVTCQVMDPNDGSAQSSVNVGVSSYPIINSLSASPSSVLAGGETELTCLAVDPDDDDVLSYEWTPGSGTITGTGAIVTWTSPASSGTYSINCLVDDGNGGTAQRSLVISVGGVWVWTQQFGTDVADIGHGMVVDAEEAAYVTGETAGSFPTFTNAGGKDMFLAKYNSDKSNAWTIQLGTSTDDVAYGVVLDSYGYVYAVGATAGDFDGNASQGGKDFFLVKYSTGGVKQWSRQYGTGPDKDDIAYAVAVDTSGNVYLAGETAGALDGANNGDKDVFLAKYDSGGTRLWVRQLGTTTYDTGRGVAVDPSGNIFVSGYTAGGLDGNENLGAADIFIAKYTQGGTKLWTKQYGTSSTDETYGVAVDTAGNVFVTGDTWGDFFSAKTGTFDAFVAKYDNDGVLLWGRQLGAPSSWTYGNALAVDVSGNAYYTGLTMGDFDGHSNLGGWDIILVKYSASGDKVWSKQFGTTAYDNGRAVSVDVSGNVYTAGETQGGMDGNSNLGFDDVFLRKDVQ